MTDEIWRAVPGYGGHYEASSMGRVRVLPRTIIRKHSTGRMAEFHYAGHLLNPARRSKLGHLSVTLGQDGKDKSVFVHRLVLLAFTGLPEPGLVGCHGNGDPGDNRIVNLRWDTVAANNADRKRHGRYAVGEKHHMSRIDEATAVAIRHSGLGCGQASKKFGISRSQAFRIIKGQGWAHLNDTVGRLAK